MGAVGLIDRNLLKYGFSEASFPNLLCSRCQKGTLVARDEVKKYHPAFSQIIQREEWSYWDDVELRLSVTLRCANSNCGEEHIAYARGGIEPCYDHNGNTDYEEFFKIHFIVPSPHIIDLPEKLPDTIKREFLASFDNYWAHKNLAANFYPECARRTTFIFRHRGRKRWEMGFAWEPTENTCRSRRGPC